MLARWAASHTHTYSRFGGKGIADGSRTAAGEHAALAHEGRYLQFVVRFKIFECAENLSFAGGPGHTLFGGESGR